MLKRLGKLSGIQPGHDVVQMCLSSGGREARLGLAVRMPCFSIPEAKHTRTAPSTANQRGGPVWFQNGIEMGGLGAGRGAPSLP